jgi:hypothetical protein
MQTLWLQEQRTGKYDPILNRYTLYELPDAFHSRAHRFCNWCIVLSVNRANRILSAMTPDLLCLLVFAAVPGFRYSRTGIAAAIIGDITGRRFRDTSRDS